MTIEERVSRIEQSYGEHLTHSKEKFKQNTNEHQLILFRIDDLERSLLVYRRVVYTVGTAAGMVAGIIINYWDFFIHKLGH